LDFWWLKGRLLAGAVAGGVVVRQFAASVHLPIFWLKTFIYAALTD